MRTVIKLLAASLTLAFAADAFAYSYTTCLGEKLKWSSNSKAMGASSVSFPAGYWRTGLQQAVDATNLNPSNFRYSLVTDAGGVGRNNGQSEVWGDTGAILAGAPAIAYSYWTCFWFFGNFVHMDEVDVIFDYGAPWTWTADQLKSSLNQYTGSFRQLQTTGTHELGHGLKLNHVNSEYNIMGMDFEHIHVNGGTARAYMGEDAADGVTFLYGARASAWEDVGVVHWKYSGASGQYSDHTKTKMYNFFGGILSTFNVAGETGYRVTPGQLVQLELTYENMGKNTQNNVVVGYYISTNDLITTVDRRIGGANFSLSRGDVFTYKATLTIPADLTLNTNYWIGAVIDENNSIGEAVEWNNATYIPLRVQ